MFGDVDYDPACAYQASAPRCLPRDVLSLQLRLLRLLRGQMGPNARPPRPPQAVPLEEQLEALAAAVGSGKVRHVGISNETPWGLLSFLQASQQDSRLPRVASIQNAYRLVVGVPAPQTRTLWWRWRSHPTRTPTPAPSLLCLTVDAALAECPPHPRTHKPTLCPACSLLCRTFDAALAECCHLERVSLLAYSPLAMGLLTVPPTPRPPHAHTQPRITCLALLFC